VTAETQVTIEEIDEKSPHLETVIALGDANKKTLGFFTEGAFRKSARDRVILIALNPQKNCIGYLLYRPVRRSNIIVIVHLCVDPAYRGRGVTKQLVNSLSQKTQNFYGIQLKCRRDYGIDECGKHWVLFLSTIDLEEVRRVNCLLFGGWITVIQLYFLKLLHNN